MIPKIVHYCWFGRGEKPRQALDCIASWHKHLPEYEFVEWNEDNFDVNVNRYVREAYENRKFAFVSDYARLYGIYMMGGIYMDTDVEVIRTFDPYLHHKAVMGFETDKSILTGMIAGEKDSVWIKELLDQYNDRVFVKQDGTFDQTTNATVVTNTLVEQGLILNDQIQEIGGKVVVYPQDYFCCKDHRTGVVRTTDNSVCIHHYAGTWLSHSGLYGLRHRTKVWLANTLGERFIARLSDIITLRAFQQR